MDKKTLREFKKKSRVVIKDLKGLEKKYGEEVSRYSMRKHLTQVMEEQKRIKEIKKLENELEELRKKR